MNLLIKIIEIIIDFFSGDFGLKSKAQEAIDNYKKQKLVNHFEEIEVYEPILVTSNGEINL